MSDYLWGNKARGRYLLWASVILLFTLLGSRDLWTQEHRWADIVSGMFYRHDFLHPYLGGHMYYDKPLLSYWLIVLTAKLVGHLSVLTLRIPSALAGLLAIGSIYQLGTSLKNKSLGLLAGWLLLTTFYFLFWARTSSADMLNVGGSLFAIAWYIQKRHHARFFDYAVFFMAVALTSLCKGLVGAVVPFIAVMIDIVLQRSWKQHMRWPLFLALIPALIIYMAPFLASSWVNADNYSQSGLYLVYRENILRYFQPFDHQGPIYTYLLYLPIYLLPWAVFFIPALYALKRRWQTFNRDMKWLCLTLLALFLFFSLSGSRRSYYVLPMVPFAILLTAEWLLSLPVVAKQVSRTIVLSYVCLACSVVIAPAWYYSHQGVAQFATALQARSEHIQPWQAWQVVMLDAESKLDFYLQLPPGVQHYSLRGERGGQTSEHLAAIWPVIKNKPTNTIFITRKRYLSSLSPYFSGYQVVISKKKEGDAPVAFIPS